ASLLSYFQVSPEIVGPSPASLFSLEDILLPHKRLPSRTECTDLRDIQEVGHKCETMYSAFGKYSDETKIELFGKNSTRHTGVLPNSVAGVVLQKMCQRIFTKSLNAKMLHFDSPENPEISQVTFICLYCRTVDSSQNAYNEDTSALVEPDLIGQNNN
uniref:Uncharacterized protein n=1 Tax=Hucho hucho TaxID=62062 RepID=A0A4W5MVP7_9TELE